MSKKAKKQKDQGTYALCITAGLIVGVGIGPLMGSVPITAIVGGLLGTVAGYLFTRKGKSGKRH